MPSVSVSAVTSTEIVPADGTRDMVVISNTDATAKLYVAFGIVANSSAAYIPAGGNMTISGVRWKGAINGLSSSGTITANYSKASSV